MSYLIYALIVIILAVALAPQAPASEPPSLTNIDAPTAKQGRPVPKIFGTRILQSPNIVWYGDVGYNEVLSEGGK